MSGLSRKEVFAQAVKATKDLEVKEQALKDARKNGNFGSNDFEVVNWLGIKQNKVRDVRLVRLLGDPIIMRSLGTDPRKIAYIEAVDDDGTKAKMVVPQKKTDPNHPYWVIWSKLARYKKEGENRIYEEAIKQPTLFKRVMHNDKEDSPFEKGWKVNNNVLINCIDSTDMEWHKANKKTKILTKSTTDGKDGAIFADYGIPSMVYDLIWENLVTYFGNWEDYSIAIKSSNKSPYYTPLHAYNNKNIIDVDAPELTPLVNDEMLSVEEASWERNNFDEMPMFQVSSYTKWKTRFGNFIKSFDLAYDTDLFALVEQKADEETLARAQSNASNQDEVKEEPKQSIAQSIAKTIVKSVEDPLTGQAEVVVYKEPTGGFDLNNYVKDFPNLGKLTDSEKALIIDFDATYEYETPENVKVKGIFRYSNEATVDLLPCEDCGIPFSEALMKCPKCSKDYSGIPF